MYKGVCLELIETIVLKMTITYVRPWIFMDGLWFFGIATL